MAIRQPIISILGHVDHGKTTLLDGIRKTSVASREAGGITQHIGATEVPVQTVMDISGEMLKKMKVDVTIPGLLFVDTPGHEAFTNLRKRGGNIADLAILIVDIREKFMPQTLEALEILKSYKTPFVVVANKVDLLSGWNSSRTLSISESITKQQDFIKQQMDTAVYELIGTLSEHGVESERFDRIEDFTKQAAIIPASAKTGEGLSEILMLITGLSQRYLEKNLEIHEKSPGVGNVLEVKETKGLGTSLDAIIYDGTISKTDTIALGGKSGMIQSRVKALLKPKPLNEMRDPDDKFENITSASAATGVRIVAPDIEAALPGGPIYVVRDSSKIDEYREKIQKEMASVLFDREKNGLVVKADTLGSLEALVKILEKHKYPVRKADIGAATKTDVMEASSVRKENPELGVVLAFGVPVLPEAAKMAKDSGLMIIESKVVYKIMEDYDEWREKARIEQEMKIFEEIPFPSEIKFLPDCTFRRSGPAVIGVEVIKGKIRTGYTLMKTNGSRVGKIESIQSEGEKIEEAAKGEKVAISVSGPLVGRNIDEGDTLYTLVTPSAYETIMKKGRKFLKADEMELLKEILNIVRKT